MPTRILLAKPGLDVHDRGIRVLAHACRDAGMEVILLRTGLVTVAEAVSAAIQEDVNVLGLSIMTGAPEKICRQALDELKSQKAEDIPLIVGGVIRKEKIAVLKEMGVSDVFVAGSALDNIVKSINEVAS